jgi:N-terminal 7TM region of histidine kinase
VTWFALANMFVDLFCLGVAWYTFRWRELRASKPLAALLILVAIWCITQGMLIASPTLEPKETWKIWQFVFASFIPVVWLMLVRAVTGLPSRIPEGLAAGVIGFAVLSVLLILTNPAHHLMFGSFKAPPGLMLLEIDYGPFFVAYEFVNYGELLIGLLALLQRWRLERELRRFEMALWSLCVILPTLADLSVLLHTPVLDGIEFTPLVFAATSLLTVWALGLETGFSD